MAGWRREWRDGGGNDAARFIRYSRPSITIIPTPLFVIPARLITVIPARLITVIPRPLYSSFPRKRESTPRRTATPEYAGILDSGLRRNDGKSGMTP